MAHRKVTTIKVPMPLSVKLGTLRMFPKESKASVINRLIKISEANK